MTYLYLVITVSLIVSKSGINAGGNKQLFANSMKLRKLEGLLKEETNTKSDKTNIQTKPVGSQMQNDKPYASIQEILSTGEEDFDISHRIGIGRTTRSADEFNITDSLWSTQWHLHPDQTPSMGVYEAWIRGYTGKGIVVGLVDAGIDETHSDLIDNYNASLSYDFVYNTEGGAYGSTYDNHGTRAAGVIVASKNDQCIIGVAYEATLASIRISTYNDHVTHDRVARAFTHNYNKIDIYQHAYGRGVGHGAGFYAMDEVLRSAVIQGINKGRNGKGSIYVFPAGVDGEHYDDCNADEYVSNIHTIAVSSLAPEGQPPPYVEECTCVLAATYGGRRYENGTRVYLSTTYINGTCTEYYGGPSASASVASGILALTLEANPDLTWRDVQHLIVETSITSGVLDGHFYANAVGKNVLHLYSWSLTIHGTVTNPLEGKPNNGTLGGYCDNITACVDGTDCLLESNICVNCNITEHRMVKGFCVKDGYRYCDENITCQVDNAWCNSENICETCPTGSRMIDGICVQDRSMGGYCDAITVCSDPGAGCDPVTYVCANCTDGYRVIEGYCKQDGARGGYCDSDLPCVKVNARDSCNPFTNVCLDCLFRWYDHHVVDGFCIEDGVIGGYCDNDVTCVEGAACDSGVCVNCTASGYRVLPDGSCKQDGVIGGYCDNDVTCVEGAACDSGVCVNCTASGYRVLPDGSCRQDGVLDGYCDSELPCVEFAAACLPGTNICVICYAGNTVIDGYCIEDEIPEVADEDTNVGAVAGIVIAGFVTGVLLNGIVFAVILQNALLVKTGYAPENMKDRFLHVFKMRNGVEH